MLKYLIQKEFKQIVRNKTIMMLIFLMPTLQLAILPWAADFEIKNINLSIVDHDKSDFSRRLVQEFSASPYFKIASVANSYEVGLKSIENNEADIIIEIPQNFEKDLVRENEAQISLSANAINGTKGGLGASYATSIISSFNNEIRQQYINIKNANNLPPTIDIVNQFRFNVYLNYQTFLVPGLLVFLATLICGLLSSLNLVIEKETGTIEQINVTPVKTAYFILAKVMPLWVAGYIVIIIGFLIAFFVYGIVIQGSFLLIFFIITLYIISISFAGLVISIYSATQQQSMYLSYFFIMIFLLMSGLLTPISSMPDWAIMITYFNPIRYCIEPMRLIILKGSTFMDVWKDVLAIVGFGILFATWSLVAYKKRS